MPPTEPTEPSDDSSDEPDEHAAADDRGGEPAAEPAAEPTDTDEAVHPGAKGVASDADEEPEPESEPPEDSARARLEAEADRAVSEFDESVVDLLAWLLDTETRARIYVYLRQHPHSTSEEVADGTGLYPSTVREALAELHEEGTVTRRKRESAGAGNNPYAYTAIAPSDLVKDVVEQVQSELNTVFNLDRHLGRPLGNDGSGARDTGPVSITVDDEDDEASDQGRSGTDDR
ncbi:MAG: helix-turn-helix domain-containing protein [Haloquadratum sp.]